MRGQWRETLLARLANPMSLLGLLVAIYLFTNLIAPRILPIWPSTYLVRPLLWGAIALAALGLWRRDGLLATGFSRTLLLPALLVGIAQVSILVLVGVLMGFGRSPYDHSPFGIIINVILVSSSLIGVELCRAYLLARLGKGESVLILGITALFFTVIATPTTRFASLVQETPVASIPFIASDLFPLLSVNLLASYLAMAGGPLPAIAYRGVLLAFEWLSPILPDLPWAVTALLGTTLPIVGLLVVESPGARDASAVCEHDEGTSNSSSAVGWLAVALIGLAGLSFSLGLLPVHGSLIGSGSMEPILYVGDVAIVRKLSGDRVGVGDLVQFKKGNLMVLHRVVGVSEGGGHKFFITKGDSNNAADPDPVSSKDIVGKVIGVIPKVGWIAIAVRTPTGLAGLVGGTGLLLIVTELAARRRRQRRASSNAPHRERGSVAVPGPAGRAIRGD